jgi:hypothetical protein
MLKYVKYVGLESAVSDPDSESQHGTVVLRVQHLGSLSRASTFKNCKSQCTVKKGYRFYRPQPGCH